MYPLIIYPLAPSVNLKCLWLASSQLDLLLGKLMEPMTRWTVMQVDEEPKNSEESKEELGSSKSKEVSRQCD